MATKPEFLVAKEKTLVALVAVSVAILSPEYTDTLVKCDISSNDTNINI